MTTIRQGRYFARGPDHAIPLHGWLVDPEAGLVYGRSGHPLGSNHQGYRAIDASSRGLGKVFVHRLVWETVHGPIPEGLEPNHKNGIKDDNRIINLELVTRSENLQHAYANGLKSNRGERHPSHRLTETTVREIRRLHAIGKTLNALAAQFGTTPENMRHIVRRRTWTHVSQEALIP